jgi:hypothetical protein
LGALPPRKITWQSSLPVVDTIAEWPALVTDRKWCGACAARMASMAILHIAVGAVLESHRTRQSGSQLAVNLLSVVRAPMAPHDTRSAMYCGVIMSRNSQPAGTAALVDIEQQLAPMRKPSLMRKLPSRLGSLISPFQPTVVRGFSK